MQNSMFFSGPKTVNPAMGQPQVMPQQPPTMQPPMQPSVMPGFQMPNQHVMNNMGQMPRFDAGQMGGFGHGGQGFGFGGQMGGQGWQRPNFGGFGQQNQPMGSDPMNPWRRGY